MNPLASAIVIVMGVAGAGKTTVGQALAKTIGAEFADADQFHSDDNKRKMAAGIPLTDADRMPWLNAMRDAIVQWSSRGQSAVLACSALKQSYRELLKSGAPETWIVYLRVDEEVVRRRLESRSDHYMKSNMIPSQFETLEEPSGDQAVIVDATQPVDRVVALICETLPKPVS
jgi:gluconokinase